MFYPESNESKGNTDATEDQHMVLDGTVNPDYPDDEPIPRVKGLIELLHQYLGRKSSQGR